MKKIIFYFFILTDISSQMHAQSICATPGNVPDPLQSIGARALATPSNNYVLRIFVHVMRRSNGTGGQSQADVTQGLNTVVADYAPHGICVSLLGKDEIWNDSYYNMGFPTDGPTSSGKFVNFSPNSHSNAIDIYLFGTDGNIQGGLAANIVATALVLGGTAFGSNLASSHVLSHELGHCAGLYHTFHGLCNNEGGCRELVNGSNSTNCGDFVGDTPADPQMFQANSDCSWNGSSCTGSSTDANGQRYSPNMHLIMAYIPPNCMQLFTNGQGTRMRTTIANSSVLQAVTVPNTLTISSQIINTGESRLYDVLNYLTAQNIIVLSNGSLTLRAGQEITLQDGFQALSGSFFQAYIDDACSTTDQPNAARESITNAVVPKIPIGPDDAVTLTADIYPNPVTGLVNIFINSNTSHFIELKAISVNGVVVRSMKSQVKGVQRIQWDVSGLSQGIYFIQITDGTQTINKKVFKSN